MQSDNKLVKLDYLLKMKHSSSLIILLVFWAFSADILSKSFNSLLLDSYFYQAKAPGIETLEQLLSDKEIPISISGNTFKILSRIESLKKEQVNSLKQRVKNYESHLGYKARAYPIFYDRKIFDDLVNRKSIIISSGFQGDAFLAKYHDERQKFHFSQEKYILEFIAYKIRKVNPMRNEIKFA